MLKRSQHSCLKGKVLDSAPEMKILQGGAKSTEPSDDRSYLLVQTANSYCACVGQAEECWLPKIVLSYDCTRYFIHVWIGVSWELLREMEGQRRCLNHPCLFVYLVNSHIHNMIRKCLNHPCQASIIQPASQTTAKLPPICISPLLLR